MCPGGTGSPSRRSSSCWGIRNLKMTLARKHQFKRSVGWAGRGNGFPWIMGFTGSSVKYPDQVGQGCFHGKPGRAGLFPWKTSARCSWGCSLQPCPAPTGSKELKEAEFCFLPRLCQHTLLLQPVTPGSPLVPLQLRSCSLCPCPRESQELQLGLDWVWECTFWFKMHLLIFKGLKIWVRIRNGLQEHRAEGGQG